METDYLDIVAGVLQGDTQAPYLFIICLDSINAHEMEYMCFNQTGDISTLGGGSLKLVDTFTYLGSSVSSTEKDIDTRLTKAWTAFDRLSVI